MSATSIGHELRWFRFFEFLRMLRIDRRAQTWAMLGRLASRVLWLNMQRRPLERYHVSWSHDLGHARQVGLNKNIWLVLGRWLVGSTENLKETWTNANNNALRCNVYVDEKDKCKSVNIEENRGNVTSTIFRVMEAHWHELAATGYIGLILLLVTSFTGDVEDDGDDMMMIRVMVLILLLVTSFTILQLFFQLDNSHDNDLSL